MLIKATHSSIKAYHARIREFEHERVSHEGAVRSAFQNLLDVTARKRGWTLIPDLELRVRGRRIVPDGTLRDHFQIPRGYWEAKDTDDVLDREIQSKIEKGYPLNNTIFEDTRHGVLFQDDRETFRADLRRADQVAELLNALFDYAEPQIQTFEQAVTEFKERVPELARALVGIIEQAHSSNRVFQEAFARLFAQCQHALNPNIRRDAVDEMLVQHLLTIRLFRTIFSNPDFNRRNAIAAELEGVVDALTSRSFSRDDFLRPLDRFYVAIEEAARGLTDFSEKQHFINTVYERFFQGYSVKVADTHGIVYTPQPIVDFMVNSVEEVLRREFGLHLSSPGVHILDPCTGTGNFLVNILRRVPARDLPRVYREQLFANEVMLLPYYIAALNIEHAYFERTENYEPFEGLCFVDTLDMAEHPQDEFEFMSERNTERVEREKAARITVIIGNPPYNVGQLNENDNNKNRKYKVVDERIRHTYAADSTATNKNALFDAYVKFFRWATDRLEGRDGIVCFISNNSFVDQLAFDGMRKHLASDFTRIFHLDLHGNVRRNPKLSGTTHNVFGIQVGVGITVAVRAVKDKQFSLSYHRVPEDWRKAEKFQFLNKSPDVAKVRWRNLRPSAKNAWIGAGNEEQFATFPPVGTKEARAAGPQDAKTIFASYSGGVKTNRDMVVYDFDRQKLTTRIQQFIEAYNSEVDRWKRAPEGANVDDFVKYQGITWSRDLKLDLVRGHYVEFVDQKVRTSLYRPFHRRILFFDRVLNEEVYGLPRIFPTPETERENVVIVSSDLAYRAPLHSVLVTDRIPDLHLCAAIDSHQCFPFFVYDEDGTNRRENITDWALAQFREHYESQIQNPKPKMDKWAIFHYVYGLLHHPGYREKYADCLKRELPRIPLAPDFWAFAEAGKELAHWHLSYEDVEPYELDWVEMKGKPLSYRVEKMRLLGPDGKLARSTSGSAGYGPNDRFAVAVNDTLTLGGIPPQVFDYRLGNRSALEWVIDQYQVTTDKRSGITHDPNRADDPDYIVRLIGQVVRVSLETVRIINALPANFGG